MPHTLEQLKIKPRCLQCGREIVYGRADRKFCCEACKNRYHNLRRYPFRERYESAVLQILDRNRTILSRLWKMGVESIDLVTLSHLGFDPHYMTGYRRLGRHHIFTIFEMQYEMSPSRIKKLVSLSSGKEGDKE